MAQKKSESTKAIPNWGLFIGLVQLAVFIIIMSLGYLLLEKQIMDWVTHKPNIAKRNNARNTSNSTNIDNWNKVVNGIHVRSGLYSDPHLQTIIGACTSCHSSKLIIQNRATREGWEQMIRWMQQTQNLGDLGSKESIILDYLAQYYAPSKEGRRKNVDIEAIEWYALDIDAKR